MASSLEENVSIMLDRGSALKHTQIKAAENSPVDRNVTGKKWTSQLFSVDLTDAGWGMLYLRWGPAHQRILPPLSGVEVHLPFLGTVDARLHGGFGGDKDVDLTSFDVLFWDPGQSSYVLRDQKKKKYVKRWWRNANLWQKLKNEESSFGVLLKTIQ